MCKASEVMPDPVAQVKPSSSLMFEMLLEVSMLAQVCVCKY